MMTNSSTYFSLDKRNFLHYKLDEILNSWVRKSCLGTFFLTVTDGVPTFQFGLNFDLSDAVSAPEAQTEPNKQQHHPLQGHPRRGQAKQARNRARAQRFQAAQAAAAAAPESCNPTFPGRGQALGNASKPVLSITLKIGDAFPLSSTKVPNPAQSSTSVVPPPPSTSTSSKTPSFAHEQPTNFAGPVKCRDAILSDESDDETDEEQFYSCGQCDKDINSDSPSYYCPLCVKCYHIQCIAGHRCLPAM